MLVWLVGWLVCWLVVAAAAWSFWSFAAGCGWFVVGWLAGLSPGSLEQSYTHGRAACLSQSDACAEF